MKRFAIFLIAGALAVPAFAQNASKPFLGRWDLTVTNGTRTWPQWMEVVEKDGKIEGRS
jgi:hypothetical protein